MIALLECLCSSIPAAETIRISPGRSTSMRMAICLFLAFTYGVMVLAAFGHHRYMTTVIVSAAARC